MKIQVRLFASLKDKAGQPHIQLDWPQPGTVMDLKAAIAAGYPQLAPALPTALVAVNKAYAAEDTPVTAADEVAIFPPVSGGSHAWPHPTYFAITHDPLDLNAIHAALTEPDVGAIVSFTGHVRGQTARDGLPDSTLYLEYEAYEEMATQKMAQIAQEIWDKWPLVKGVAVVQRIGRLDVGDVTTFVACAAGHRDQGAFDAARYGIDRLKQIVSDQNTNNADEHAGNGISGLPN
ncbi:MAG: molybdenum cofactor biosynthesis protein MoaE [Chloroflexota bacterium]